MCEPDEGNPSHGDPSSTLGRVFHFVWAVAIVFVVTTIIEIACIGFAVSRLYNKLPPEQVGEITGIAVFRSIPLVFVVSILWYKNRRIIAVSLLGVAVLAAVLLLAGNMADTDMSNVTYKMSSGAIVVLPAERGSLIRHSQYGIEITGPVGKYEISEMQGPHPQMHSWLCQNVESGELIMLTVAPHRLATATEFREYLDGVIKEQKKWADNAGAEVIAIYEHVVTEIGTADYDFRIGAAYCSLRVVSVDNKLEGKGTTVSVQAICDDLDAARAIARSASVPAVFQW